MTDRIENKVQLPIAGMSCESCAHHIQQVVCRIPGVTRAKVSYPGKTAIVDFRPAEVGGDEIKLAIEGAGYAVEARASFQIIQTRAGLAWVQAFIEAVDLEKCNGCGKCVRACGQNVYALVEIDGRKKAAIINGDECLGDCHCHKACLTDALICRPRRLDATVP
ncbi:MAG: cation transporter [Chloroflexi bacterium]|nr:cation transporter [Chloroflexota bacterium]